MNLMNVTIRCISLLQIFKSAGEKTGQPSKRKTPASALLAVTCLAFVPAKQVITVPAVHGLAGSGCGEASGGDPLLSLEVPLGRDRGSIP